jgi:tetratricopeptide (TPR) repeat protein
MQDIPDLGGTVFVVVLEAPMHNSPKHFFISYNKADRTWAEWIAWQLEEEGYTTIIQAWDFRPGVNFVHEMHEAVQEAERTIAVLSTNYLDALYTYPEWEAAFQQDPKGEKGLLVPVRIQACNPPGLLGLLASLDLVGLEEAAAHDTLLAGIRQGRNKPPTAPLFPGTIKEAQRSAPQRPRFPGAFPALWNLPAQRNPFFTGRETILTRLEQAFTANTTTARQPHAISGLGGVGKTQTALEYAYRSHSRYQAVLWANASSQTTLLADVVAIAALLNLPEKEATDQQLTLHAVTHWLRTTADWLLILDNADDLAMVRPLLPLAASGHILLTTRAQALGGMAHRIEIEEMPPDEGALFLLRRAELLAADAALDAASAADRVTAQAISQALDGLPLALDQAAAYLEETGSSLSDYLNLYRTQRLALLKRRGGLTPEHPESVATTWSLSFQKVKQANPAAVDLLSFLAFLSPDAIPEEIITGGAPDLGPSLRPVASDPLKLAEAIGEVLKYSLVHRDPNQKTLTIHRLVQEVLREAMNKQIQRKWAERTVRAINRAFPDVTDVATWPQCQHSLPHALACADLIRQYTFTFPEAARLLNQAAFYLHDRASYREAEPLYQRALAIREQQLGPDHPDTAQSLNNLAELYRDQGKYPQAEPLYQRALAIREQQLGADHPDTALSLNNLAALYHAQGKYPQAEPLLKRALTIREQQLGADHPRTALSLNNLAELYRDQGKYPQAEPLLKRALAIWEQQLGADHPDTAASLNNLAELYHAQGKYPQAEPLYQRALAICEQQLGADHPDTAQSLNNLAALYRDQGKYPQAEPLLKRALAIWEQQLGPDHPDTAQSLNNLAALYRAQGKYEQAEPLYQRALAIREQQLGPDHPDTAQSLNNLAAPYRAQGKYEQAEPLYQRALAISEQQLGPDHPLTATIQENYAELLKHMRRKKKR